MKDYSIKTVINNYFNIYHKDKTVIWVDLQSVNEEYKSEHPNAEFQIEVEAVYSIEKILLGLGYSKEEISKNRDNDSWLEKVERKHALAKGTLIQPFEYYLFIEDTDKGKHGYDNTWKNYYNELKAKFKAEKSDNSMDKE